MLFALWNFVSKTFFLFVLIDWNHANVCGLSKLLFSFRLFFCVHILAFFCFFFVFLQFLPTLLMPDSFVLALFSSHTSIVKVWKRFCGKLRDAYRQLCYKNYPLNCTGSLTLLEVLDDPRFTVWTNIFIWESFNALKLENAF